MKLYSIQDLSIARWLTETKDKLSHREVDIKWANKVIYFFNRLYAYARKCIGHWTARITLAWRWARNILVNKLEQWITKSREKDLDYVLRLIERYGEQSIKVQMKWAKYKLSI